MGLCRVLFSNYDSIHILEFKFEIIFRSWEKINIYSLVKWEKDTNRSQREQDWSGERMSLLPLNSPSATYQVLGAIGGREGEMLDIESGRLHKLDSVLPVSDAPNYWFFFKLCLNMYLNLTLNSLTLFLSHVFSGAMMVVLCHYVRSTTTTMDVTGRVLIPTDWFIKALDLRSSKSILQQGLQVSGLVRMRVIGCSLIWGYFYILRFQRFVYTEDDEDTEKW